MRLYASRKQNELQVKSGHQKKLLYRYITVT